MEITQERVWLRDASGRVTGSRGEMVRMAQAPACVSARCPLAPLGRGRPSNQNEYGHCLIGIMQEPRITYRGMEHSRAMDPRDVELAAHSRS